MSHTPGPWTHEKNKLYAALSGGVYIQGPAGQTIAHVLINESHDWEADTLAIKALPDLLEACEALFSDDDRANELRQLIKQYYNEPIQNLLDRVYPELRAAITKAKGE